MTTFWGGLGTGVGSAVGSVIGSKFGSKGKSRLSQSLAQIAHQNRVWSNAAKNAPKYGIHPLIALGHQSYAPSGGTGTGSTSYGEAGAQLGSAIGQAITGKGERRAAKLRQLQLDKMNLAKHEAELAALHAEANRNNAIADSALASIRNRNSQSLNSKKDDLAVSVTGGRDERFPEGKEHNIRIGGKNWKVEGGTTGQTIEDIYGEAGSILMIPKMYRDMRRNYIRPRADKFYDKSGKALGRAKRKFRDYYEDIKYRNKTNRNRGTRRY